MNPFHARGPITQADHFFGRKREVEATLARTVGSSKPQCCSIVGLRRIGKSSLLRHLVDARGPELARADKPAVFAYESLEGTGSLTVPRFFAALRRNLLKRVGRAGIDVPQPKVGSPDDAEESFSEWIEELTDAGVRVILALDEFDVVTMNPAFDAAFFGRLRWLAGTHDLAFVTSSFAPLSELCHHEEIRQSPFFNVFTALHLGLLLEGEADELLLTESERAGDRFEEQEIAFVRSLGGRHPFHLQQAASALWEADDPIDPQAILAAFLEEAVPHFRYAVAHLSSRERSVLHGVAAGKPPTRDEEQEASFLLRRGLIVSEASGLAPFSQSFATWLRQQEHETPVLAARTWHADPATDTAELPRAPREGSVLDSRYHLVRELGRGGFGIVFEAEDRTLHRRVAVKVLRQERLGDAKARESRERFLREARAAARISHANVVTLHDVGEHEGQLFVVMEMFPGRSLRELLQERGALPPREGIELLIQAADGLAAAHALGIVHRDVKPDNLMVDEERRLKVVDFGLALMADHERLTPHSVAIVTPRYCSPEQVLSAPVGPASDVFSLGCVLHEVLTGEHAFDGDSISAVFYRILHESPPRLDPALPGLGPEIVAILRACLAREPSDRPATALEVAQKLRTVSATFS